MAGSGVDDDGERGRPVCAVADRDVGHLTYYLMPTAQLPLLDPLRMLPILGNPLADLLQPFLKPIVDLGYAPGLLPGLNPLSVAGYVGQGATAGIASPLVAGLPPLVSNSVASGF
jgi:hypothetical protein